MNRSSTDNASGVRLYLSSYYFLYYGALGLFMPYWGRYLHSKGFSSEETGLLISIIGFGKIIAPNWWAYKADQSGQRVLIIRLGTALTLFAFGMVYWADSLFYSVLAFVLLSFCWNAMMPQLEVITLDFCRLRNASYNRIRLWGSVGFIVMASLFGLLADNWGIGALPVAIILVFCAMLLNAFLLSGSGQRGPVLTDKKPCWRHIANKSLLLFLLCYFLLQMSHAPYYTFFDLHLTQAGVPGKYIGLIISLGVMAEIVMFMASGKLILRFGWHVLLQICFALTAIRWMVLALFSDNLPLVVASQLLHAVSFGLCHNIGVYWIFTRFPDALKSQGQAIFSSVTWGLGSAIGNILAGYTWQNGAGARLSFGLAAVLCVSGFLVIRFSGLNRISRQEKLS